MLREVRQVELVPRHSAHLAIDLRLIGARHRDCLGRLPEEGRTDEIGLAKLTVEEVACPRELRRAFDADVSGSVTW
jgi:hypothetical protein